MIYDRRRPLDYGARPLLCDHRQKAWKLPGRFTIFHVEAVALLPTPAAFVPGTGWPEPGGFLPREVLKFLQVIAGSKPIAGIEIVECSPPYDAAEVTALIST